MNENWTSSDKSPTRDDVGALRARLRSNPRDRALYNQLSFDVDDLNLGMPMTYPFMRP